jgi:signal transduction histidine kinase
VFKWGAVSVLNTARNAGLESHYRQKGDAMSEGMADARILPIRPGVGLTVVSLIAGILAVLVARDCHRNLEFHHVQAPFVASLLYGGVYWIWWVGVTLVLWIVADRWAAAFKPSAQTFVAHLGVSCVLATTHLVLLQHTVWFSSLYWPEVGRVMAPLYVETLERFGVELVLYGFISGICVFLHSRMQTQQALVQKLELERQPTQAQLTALQMQVEPHFLFNTLNAITALVEEGSQKEAAETLAHLNEILKSTLVRETPEKITLAQELAVVEHYLAIEQVRFADRLRVEISIDPGALDSMVPCFLLQPIVENAIRHGISPLQDAGIIHASVERDGDMLHLSVRDNGPGLTSKPNRGHGIGLRNTEGRLAHFYPEKYTFTSGTGRSGGFEVSITIPYARALA